MNRIYAFMVLMAMVLTSCQFFAPEKQKVKAGQKSADGTFIKKRHFNDEPTSPVEWEISMKFREEGGTAIRHGLSKRYSKSGKLVEKINYVDNKKDGMRISYHSTGKVYKEQPYKNGRLDGTCKRYDREGRLVAEYPYKNGLVGAGLKMYTNLGKQRPEPSLIVKKENRIRTSNAYLLTLTIGGEGAKYYKSVEYYEGQLIDDKYVHKNLTPAKQLSSKKGEIRIKVPKGASVNKTFNLIAVCKTSDGLKLVLQKKVHVDARGV